VEVVVIKVVVIKVV
jgi:hypothetical protein